MSAQFIEAVESLLRFFGDLHGGELRVDFNRSYRTRMLGRKVECVAKCLDHRGDVFQADALRLAYARLNEVVYAEPVHPGACPLSDKESRRLEAMDNEDRKLAMDRQNWIGSEGYLQQELRAAAGRMVDLLVDVKQRIAEPLEGTAPRVPLTEEDKTILEALAKEGQMAVNQYDLEAETRITRRTIGGRLKYLEAQGLIARPEGMQRKGHTITAAGLLAIGRPVP